MKWYFFFTFSMLLLTSSAQGRVQKLKEKASYCAKQKDWKGAIKVYNRLIKIDSLNVHYYFQRGYCKEMALQYTESISDFTKVIQLDSTKCITRTNRGYAYRNIGEYDLAIQDFQDELRINPNTYSNEHIAMVYYLKMDYEKALEHVNISIQLDSNQAIAYKTRGLIYFAMNDPQKGCYDIEKAKNLGILTKYPKYTEEINGLEKQCE